MATISIGISGWRYPPWRGVFYPPKLPQKLELWYASRILPAIEINGSFYSLQRPAYYARWYDETPPGFLFAVKGPRFITHIKRLVNIQAPLANFFASGVFNLREKLAPVLWQFPPTFQYDHAVMRDFLAMLPYDLHAAREVARRHDPWMAGRTQLDSDLPDRLAVRHAFEIRHPSFLDERFIELLREYGVALVVAETARKWPMAHDVTADFIYMRLHGDEQLYKSGYSDTALDSWANRITAWHAGGEPPDADKVSPLPPPSSKPRDVFCFFDNTDVKLRAPIDAQTLMRKLGLTPGEPPWPQQQMQLRRAS
jgi:uncharacterized protein YecE (DUF72 family)